MSKLVHIALKYEGSPAIRYRGPEIGNNPEGFDCSGFVQRVMLESGVQIPNLSNGSKIRHSEEFFDFFGILIHPPARQPGDLIFFSRDGYRPTHLGIYLGDGEMIHSPGKDDRKVCIRSVEDFCDKNRIQFKPENSYQIYFENPIGYKRIAVPSGTRYQIIQ